MKTQPTTGPSQARRVNVPEEPKKKSGAFAKVLEQKAGEEKKPEPLPMGTPQLLPRTAVAESPVPVKSTASVRHLDGIAQEIAVKVTGADLKEVEIKMDSKTLAGLEIRISKQNGKLWVRLQSESADISRMLAQQTGGLADRLEQRGYPGAIVQVQNPAASAFREQRPARDPREQGSRGQQGNPDQRRDRQK